jgi:site-specific DNA recombinase
MNNNKYFLYVRKSTDTEDKQIQSLDDQINIMKKKAEILWINIIETFSESMSAKAPWRYRFNEMIERINSWEARGVISWKIDRLTRNPVDTWTIQFMLQNGTLDKIITNDREYNPVDAWLLFSVETWMSNQFILDLKKNVKRWMDSKTDKWIFCWKAPEGYRNNRLEKTIEIDSERYTLVRKMWDMMLTWNYSVPQVMRIANNDWGFKRKKVWKTGATELKLSGMYKMFTNPFYTWDFMWKGVIKKWTHTSMVSYEEFYRVQELLWVKGLTLRGKTKEFAYTWFIKCWECGSAITWADKQKKIKTTWETKTYVYYNCTKRQKGCEGCTQKPIRLEDLEKQIDQLISNTEIIPEFKEWALDILKDDFHNDVLEKEKILKSLYSSQLVSERRLNKLTDSLIDEIITKDEYTVRKKHLQMEINNYREQISKLNKHKDTSLKITEEVFDFVISAKTKFNHGDLQTKKEILRWFGWNFELKDKKLLIDQHKWFIPIKKLSSELKREKAPLELIKNSTTMGKSSANNRKISVWYSQRELNSCPSLEKAMS